MSNAQCYSGGIFDYESKAERLEEVLRQMEDPDIWQNPQFAQELGQEKSSLEKIVNTLGGVANGVTDCMDMLELAAEEQDQDLVDEVTKDLDNIETNLAELEFQRMFSGQMDQNNAFICLLYTSPSPRDQRGSRMPSSA